MICDVDKWMVNPHSFADLSCFASATAINIAGEVLGMYADICLEPNPHSECPIGFIPFFGGMRGVLWEADGSGESTELPSPAAAIQLVNIGVLPGALSNSGFIGASAGLREPSEFLFGSSIGMLRDQSGEPALLDDAIPGFTIVNITDINDAGHYCGIGSIDRTQETRGFYFDLKNGYTVLPRLSDESAGIEQANAVALNNNGQVIGAASILTIIDRVALPEPFGAFLWDSVNGMTNLGLYDVQDINDQGHIVGSMPSLDDESVPYAALYDGNQWHNIQGLTSVDPVTWRLAYAAGINNAGQIIVNGLALNADQILESGEVQPFPLTPIDPISGDLNNDGVVNVSDLLLLLGEWGPCLECGDCPADLNHTCAVGVSDLLILLANWG